jgi:AcrR family transcriptional regulator
MARPIAADAEATRRRILAAARALFSEHGLAETTMRQIASEADVSMATVHHYYGGKNDLYRACIEAMYVELSKLRSELEELFLTSRAGDPSLGAFIDAAVRRSYAFAHAHRPIVQLMMRTILSTGELEADKRERYLLPFLDEGARVLAPLLGQSPLRVRMALLSLNHLIVRFTLAAPRELALVVDRPDASDEEAIRAVEDYLVALARDQLAVPGESR